MAVTTGGTEKKSHGLAEFVAQEEMGRFTGYWWSPDAKSIAFEEADAQGVEVWHVADPFHPDQAAQPFYYPRPGKANVKVRLGIVSVSPVFAVTPAGGGTVWVEWDDKTYPYLADVKWDKKGPLTILVQNRTQTKLVLLKVDPATGKTTPLLTEKDAAWVNLRHDGPRWLNDGSFLWPSAGEKGPQLERREKDGALREVLIPPAVGFEELVDVDPKAGLVYFRASRLPTDSMLYSLPVQGGKPTAPRQGSGRSFRRLRQEPFALCRDKHLDHGDAENHGPQGGRKYHRRTAVRCRGTAVRAEHRNPQGRRRSRLLCLHRAAA